MCCGGLGAGTSPLHMVLLLPTSQLVSSEQFTEMEAVGMPESRGTVVVPLLGTGEESGIGTSGVTGTPCSATGQ